MLRGVWVARKICTAVALSEHPIRLSAYKKHKMMTYLTLGPSWQSTDKASCQGYLLEDTKSSLVVIPEKFLIATTVMVKQQWPGEIRIAMRWIK